MLKARKESCDDHGMIHLQGDLIIDHAEELKTLLQEATSATAPIAVDCSQTGSIDLFGLQVLLAAARDASRSGQGLFIIEQGAEAIRRAMSRCGVTSGPDSLSFRDSI